MYQNGRFGPKIKIGGLFTFESISEWVVMGQRLAGKGLTISRLVAWLFRRPCSLYSVSYWEFVIFFS